MSVTDPVETRIKATRTELEETLDAIEEKLNVPKQIGTLTEKAKDSYAENPTPWIAGAAVAVVVLGGLVAWAIFGKD